MAPFFSRFFADCCGRAALLALACIGVCGHARAADTLSLCAEGRDIRPWITHEGGGLNFELLNRVATQLGLHLEYRQMAWKRCLEDLRRGEVDGAFGASFKPERLAFGAYPGGEKADVSKRLNMDRYVLVRSKGEGLSWDGQVFSGLNGAIGTQLGYSVADHLRGMGVTVDEGAPGPDELLRKLFMGYVQAAAMLEGEARSQLSEVPKYGAVLEILPVPLLEKPYYLLLSHRFVASRAKLAEALWQGVEQVREGGEYQALEKQALSKQRSTSSKTRP